MACALGRFWYHRGHYSEGRRWLLVALTQVPEPSPVRAHALLWAGILARLQGDMGAARPLCEESLALFRTWDDQVGAAMALENIGWTDAAVDSRRAIDYFQESLALFRRLGDGRQSGRLLTTLAQMNREGADLELAAQQLHEALTRLREVDDPQGTAQALNGLGELASLAGDYDQAARLLTESLALTVTAGSKQDLAWVHCGLAENGWHRGDYRTALRHGQDSHQLFEELESAAGLSIVLHHLSLIWLALDDVEPAAQCLHRSLALCHSAGREFMQARCLAGLADVAMRRGQAKWGCQLLSVATACFTRYPHQLTPADTAFYDRLIEECHGQLDDGVFLKAWEEGKTMSVEECVACASQRHAIGRA